MSRKDEQTLPNYRKAFALKKSIILPRYEILGTWQKELLVIYFISDPTKKTKLLKFF